LHQRFAIHHSTLQVELGTSTHACSLLGSQANGHAH